MGTQVEFLVLWSNVVQKMVDWYLIELERWPTKIAERHWQHKMKECQADLIPNPDNRQDVALSNDICQCAVLYMDLLVRYGCFDRE
jgi:hypothetical protein